jgi:two-component system CheB/CheR fusion protein
LSRKKSAPRSRRPRRGSGAHRTSKHAPGHPGVPVVGIGASAGGYEAFLQLLRALPERTGMAFVLVQHLDPTHESQLTSLLSKATRMPVSEITDRTQVVADHVYVIPPNKNLALERGVLRLTPRARASGQHLPVDTFLTSLAVDRGPRAIGVILSGTASDGVLGMKAIKAAGGLTFAQDDRSAKYTSMPRNAVAAGCVDLVLSPEGIAAELARVGRHPDVAPPVASTRAEPPPKDEEQNFAKVLALLQTATGADFRDYKQTTVRRRIARRMLLHRIETVGEYARHLEGHPPEAVALRQDLLINVTAFFRDPGAFAVLRGKVFPSLMKKRSSREPWRVWVPACATGEEAYSVAMCLLEFLGDAGAKPSVHIFATDVSAPAIERARAGSYPAGIAADVSPERLRRFFVEEDGSYKVSKALRDLVVFAPQDVTADPPFSKLDLISCRNMLIYFSPELQNRIVPIFHYALKPGGFLLLGPAESLGTFAHFFAPLDKKHKIYAKRPVPARLPVAAVLTGRTTATGRARTQPTAWVDAVAPRVDLEKAADRLIVKKYGPAGVIVNSAMEILQFRGRTGPYLESAPGTASLNLLKNVREGLLGELRAAIRKAKSRGGPARAAGVRLTQHGRVLVVDIEVIPLRAEEAGDTTGGAFLVLFEEEAPRAASPGPRPRHRATGRGAGRELAALQRELAASKEYLQSIIDEGETSNEALRLATEEIQSSNEELQSTNEEMETAKEELQSSNEELTTVNDEMQARNLELAQVNSDLTNVLTSVSIPLVIVGRDLRIRRFSGATDRLLKLVVTDVGRPIGDIQLRINVTDLERMLVEVTDTLMPQEREIQDQDGRWATMRIRPYRTEDDRIDGAIISFMDIDALKRARDYAETIVETVRTPLLVLDGRLRVVTANRAFYDTFLVLSGETVGHSLPDLGNGQWNIPALSKRLEGVIPDGRGFEDLEMTHDFERLGRRVMRLNARRFESPGGDGHLILLAIEDVTARDRAEVQLRRHGQELANANRAKDDFLAVLSHELRTPLTAILGWSRLLQSGTLSPERVTHALEVIDRNTKLQVQLINELLDVSRIVVGKLSLDLAPVDVVPVVHASVESLRVVAEAKGVRLTLTVEGPSSFVLGDADRLQQVVSNLLSNAIKFTPSAGSVQVRVERHDAQLVIAVTDTGLGVSPELLPHIFERFRQGDSVATRNYGGLGLGLAIARHLVELHHGTIRAESRGQGHGATFTVALPLTTDVPETIVRQPNPDGAADSSSLLVGARILVVEDESDTRDLIVVVLEHCGAEVRAVDSVAHALAEFERLPPHVLLSDITMPDEDGYAFIRRVRALPLDRGGRTPAVALTAHAHPEDLDLALAAGYDAHLTKPVEPTVLAETVARLAGRIGDRS